VEKFIILADVTCDLSKEIQEFIGMEDYINGYVNFSDGREFTTKLEWDDISREEFYTFLSNKKNKVTSAPLSPEEFYEAFKGYAEQGYDILSMSLSSKISSTYDVACKSAERIRAEYPECKVYCFDSFRMSGAFGLLTMYAHMMKNDGKSFDEIVAWLEANKHKVHQMGPIDDLIFVARRGRISMGKAIMGNFAGVKPMGDCSSDGYVSVLTKVKGINKALKLTVEYLKEVAVDLENQYIIISHSNREAYAEQLKKLIEESVTVKKVFVSDVFGSCGTNIGPGMVGVYFFGEEVSEDLSLEKEAMARVLEKANA